MRVQNIQTYSPQKTYTLKRNYTSTPQISFKGEKPDKPAGSSFLSKVLSKFRIQKQPVQSPEDLKDEEIKDLFYELDLEMKNLKNCTKVYNKVIKQELKEGKKKNFEGYVPFETTGDKTYHLVFGDIDETTGVPKYINEYEGFNRLNCRYNIDGNTVTIEDHSYPDTDLEVLIIDGDCVFYKETDNASECISELAPYDNGYYYKREHLDKKSGKYLTTTECQIDRKDLTRCYYKEHCNGKTYLYLFDQNRGIWTLSK